MKCTFLARINNGKARKGKVREGMDTMRKDNKYMLGTALEIAKELASNIVVNGETTYLSIKDFQDCDFAITDPVCEDESLESICYNSNGFHGIKQQHTGFDSNDLELIADYYGGGAGVYHSIFSGMTEQECVEVICNLIKGTFLKNGSYSDDELIIAEYI